MWDFATSSAARTVGLKNDCSNPCEVSSECSDDEVPVNTTSKEEGLECPICWESFNIVENIPYVLWCGHTLCKNCVLGLHPAALNFSTIPIKLPFFISCPWCNLMSLRLVYKGSLKFPRKNFFLLWMVESINGDRSKSSTSRCGDEQPISSSAKKCLAMENNINASLSPLNSRRPLHACPLEQSESNRDHRRTPHTLLHKSLVLFIHLMAKFPLVFIFLLVLLYAIPASAAVLALYIFITILFALPSVLVLYFALCSLGWLMNEIVS